MTAQEINANKKAGHKTDLKKHLLLCQTVVK